MKVYPLQKQIESMKRDFPFVKYKSDYEFHVIFPDYPQFLYKIELPQNYPKEKPIITRDGVSFKLPILTYWLPTCTLSNIVQNLYLVSMSNSKVPLIPPPSLSPPVKKTVPPIISNYEKKTNSLSLSNPVCESTDLTCTEIDDSEISEISTEKQDEILLQKTGNDYVDSINLLKLKFRKKEIGFNQFMTEFQRLQSIKNTQNV